MTPLGLDAASLRREIRQYRLQIRLLIGAADRSEGMHSPGIERLVNELTTDLEVDCRSRAGVGGRERMSRLEATLFVPMLSHLREVLGPAAWRLPAFDLARRLRTLGDCVGAVDATLAGTKAAARDRPSLTAGAQADAWIPAERQATRVRHVATRLR